MEMENGNRECVRKRVFIMDLSLLANGPPGTQVSPADHADQCKTDEARQWQGARIPGY